MKTNQITGFLCNTYIVNILKYIYIERYLIDFGSNETVEIYPLTLIRLGFLRVVFSGV